MACLHTDGQKLPYLLPALPPVTIIFLVARSQQDQGEEFAQPDLHRATESSGQGLTPQGEAWVLSNRRAG